MSISVPIYRPLQKLPSNEVLIEQYRRGNGQSRLEIEVTSSRLSAARGSFREKFTDIELGGRSYLARTLLSWNIEMDLGGGDDWGTILHFHYATSDPQAMNMWRELEDLSGPDLEQEPGKTAAAQLELLFAGFLRAIYELERLDFPHNCYLIQESPLANHSIFCPDAPHPVARLGRIVGELGEMTQL